jgi:1,4-alpha-glucan branching enzyme
MQLRHGNRETSGQRYSAKNTVVPVNFLCLAPEAKEVVIVGDFNSWDPQVNVMRKLPDGSWQSSFPIHSGHHRYHFLIDGVPHLDPRATGVVKMEDESKASLLSVS